LSTQFDSSLFADVADTLGLGNPAIVEKDYYVVQLLTLICALKIEHHQIVFSGGTALAKSSVKTNRMSEDVDLKLAVNQSFLDLPSRNAKRNAKRNSRKAVMQVVETMIENSKTFSIEKSALILDEYRYFSFDIRYPQEYQQAPCLRPYIKLEFVESALLSIPEKRSIQSIYARVIKSDIEIGEIACAAIIETQAEKLVSMMRRTASVARNSERDDDETLIRHIYDTYYIQLAKPSDVESLGKLVTKVIDLDIERFGNQHPRIVECPIDELRYGLQLLIDEPKYAERYKRYVSPMVYAANPVAWDDALSVFMSLANEVLNYVEKTR
jgi:predicted nucleotidyltransferase component of viral defense system